MAFKGAGSALLVGDGASPEVFTAIAAVISTSGPSQTNDEIETTNLDSTAKEFIAALKDNGSLDFELHFDSQDTEHQALFTDVAAGSTKNYRMRWADPGASPDPYIEFAAFISALSADTPPNDSVKLSGSLRITGALTLSW